MAKADSTDSDKLALTSTLLFVIGALFVLAGAGGLLQARGTRGWPAVEGRILASEVASEAYEKKNAASGRIRRTIHHRPAVRYEYVVAGRSFRGERISRLEAAHTGLEEAEAIAARHPAGSRVEVYYDPDDPGSVVLDSGVSNVSYSPIVLGAVLILGGSAMRLWTARRARGT